MESQPLAGEFAMRRVQGRVVSGCAA